MDRLPFWSRLVFYAIYVTNHGVLIHPFTQGFLLWIVQRSITPLVSLLMGFRLQLRRNKSCAGFPLSSIRMHTYVHTELIQQSGYTFTHELNPHGTNILKHFLFTQCSSMQFSLVDRCRLFFCHHLFHLSNAPTHPQAY